MAQALQGGITFKEVQAQPAYQALPAAQQVEVADDFFNKHVASQSQFQQLDQRKQQEVRQDFNKKYEIPLPEIQNIPAVKQQGPVHIDNRFIKNKAPMAGHIPMIQATPGGFAPTTTEAMRPFQAGQALGVGQVVKGATLGYVDPIKALQAAYPEQNLQQLQQSPIAQIPQEVGTALPFMVAGSGLNAGIKAAAQKLAPYTAIEAIEGGLSSPLVPHAVKALEYLQQPGWVPAMVKSGMELGGIEGLKSHPQNQFDIPARLNDAATGAAIGTLLSAGGSALGKAGEMVSPALQAGTKFVQEAFNPSGLWHQKFTPRMEELLQRFIALVEHPGLTLKEAQTVAEHAGRINEDLQAGRLTQNLPKLEKQAKMYEARAKFREMRGKTRSVGNEPQGQSQLSQGQQPAQGAQAVQQQTASSTSPKQKEAVIPAEAEEAISTYDPKFKQGRIVATKGSIDHLKSNPARMKYIQQAGYSSPEEFIDDVTKNYDSIYENTQSNGNKRLLIAQAKKKAASLMVEVAPDGQGNYKVVTVFPTNAKYLEKRKLLWERSDTLPTGSEATGSLSPNSQNASGELVGRSDQSSTTNDSTPRPALQGSIKEMVNQGLQDFGGSFEDAKALIAEVKALGKAEDDPVIKKLAEEKKALGSKRDDATKEAKAKIDAEIKKVKDERKAKRDKAGTIHPQLREVLNTGWDGSSPLADQLAVDPTKQLKAEQVEHLITDPKEKAVFDKTNEALQGGVSMRLEHQAEITGSTDAAAKITASGNVKVPVSTFTPTHYSIHKKVVDGVEKEYVAVNGYNESGHMSKYYINESPEGSKILKVNSVLKKEDFVGTTPNVELGQRKYKVADVLGLEEREAGIKTSEALTNAKDFATLFKSETIKQFNKPTQKILKQAQKRGRFDDNTLKYVLKQIEKDKEDLAKLCSLFGLK